MHVLSAVFRIVVQIAVVCFVPGGLPAVLIYQYRRLQKRRLAALEARRPQPSSADIPPETSSHSLSQSPP